MSNIILDTDTNGWYNDHMVNNKKIKAKIISSINKTFSKRFRVIDNTSGTSRSYNGMFPDVILMQPEPPKNDNILFVMKIEENEQCDLLDSAAIWKIMSDMPFFSYVVISNKRESEAKKIIQALGLRIRLATFSIQEDGEVVVKYE